MIVTVDTHEGWPGRGLEEAAESEASVGSTVLIADDDRAIRESLARALELEGYEVVSVDDGIKALTRIHHENFDTLILDVMMPNLDGLGVCRVLRSEAESENLAVYIGYLRRKLTAAGAPAVIHTVRGVGYTVRTP
jgi:DNA-binding response OmpR family regulator